MDSLTKNTGIYIRNILRNDSEFLNILGIPSAQAKNKIFFTTPVDQHKGFANPRVVINPRPSDSNELAYTGVFQGVESFLVSMWVDSIPDYSDVLDALDRIATLFNKTAYSGISDNIGEFIVSGKESFNEPDKINTRQGQLIINLNIGGI